MCDRRSDITVGEFVGWIIVEDLPGKSEDDPPLLQRCSHEDRLSARPEVGTLGVKDF